MPPNPKIVLSTSWLNPMGIGWYRQQHQGYSTSRPSSFEKDHIIHLIHLHLIIVDQFIESHCYKSPSETLSINPLLILITMNPQYTPYAIKPHGKSNYCPIKPNYNPIKSNYFLIKPHDSIEPHYNPMKPLKKKRSQLIQLPSSRCLCRWRHT